MSEDFYALLGVSSDASADELKRAYRVKARELHPDANPDDPEAEEQFKAVSRAYQVLSDPEGRARYDRFGPQAFEAGAGGGDPFAGFTDLGSIFESIFGGNPFGGGFGGRSRGPTGPPRGPDLEATTTLAFADAVFGTSAEVKVRTAVACEPCEATGAAPGTSSITCPACDGHGQVRRVRQSILGQMVSTGPCERCDGSGQTIERPCPACAGEGRQIVEKTYTVDVPAGVSAGAALKVPGWGAVGPRGGPPGDLYVHLRVSAHPRFVRDGDDLVADVHIGMAQAALGTHVEFETLDGTEDLVIPAGTQPGRVFQLRGRGVPRVHGRGRGDLLVRTVVEVPTKLSRAEDEALRSFAAERGETVSVEEGGLMSRIRSAFK